MGLSNIRQDLSSYARGINARPTIMAPVFEEAAPDISLAHTPLDIQPIDYIRFDESAEILNFRFFVDGVQRTVHVFNIVFDNIEVPVMLSNLVAGALERQNGILRPSFVLNVLVLLGPFTTMRSAGWKGSDPPGISLDRSGNFRQKFWIHANQSKILYSDTSLLLKEGEEEKFEIGHLYATGIVRQRARDRASVILRTMELQILWRILQEYRLQENDVIVLDGPLFLSFPYSRLLDSQLEALNDLNNASTGNKELFEMFFRKTIGIVKRVEIVPIQGLPDITRTSNRIPLYHFQHIVKGKNDQITSKILSLYTRFREELDREVQSIWSPITGVIRVDFAYPFLVEDSSWLDPDFVSSIRSDRLKRQKIGALVNSLMQEKFPIPQTTPHRMMTEHYAIAETEEYLSSLLLHPLQMKSLVTF